MLRSKVQSSNPHNLTHKTTAVQHANIEDTSSPSYQLFGLNCCCYSSDDAEKAIKKGHQSCLLIPSLRVKQWPNEKHIFISQGIKDHKKRKTENINLQKKGVNHQTLQVYYTIVSGQ